MEYKFIQKQSFIEILSSFKVRYLFENKIKFIIFSNRSDFNLLLYGYGSKRLILKQFAEQELQTKHHYVIIHGYMELIKLRDVS